MVYEIYYRDYIDLISNQVVEVDNKLIRIFDKDENRLNVINGLLYYLYVEKGFYYIDFEILKYDNPIDYLMQVANRLGMFEKYNDLWMFDLFKWYFNSVNLSDFEKLYFIVDSELFDFYVDLYNVQEMKFSGRKLYNLGKDVYCEVMYATKYMGKKVYCGVFGYNGLVLKDLYEIFCPEKVICDDCYSVGFRVDNFNFLDIINKCKSKILDRKKRELKRKINVVRKSIPR